MASTQNWSAQVTRAMFDLFGENAEAKCQCMINKYDQTGDSHSLEFWQKILSSVENRLALAKLWYSNSQSDWITALENYWNFVKPENESLERSLDKLDIERLRNMDETAWYGFLEHEYFRWKFTAKNRYATTTKNLSEYETNGNLFELDQLRLKLLALDPQNAKLGLEIAMSIKGLGTAGASGLLSLMYPNYFGTVDQFLVKALRLVPNLPELKDLEMINPENINAKKGMVLTEILRRKAYELNAKFNTTEWTPRKIDKVLWTSFGRN